MRGIFWVLLEVLKHNDIIYEKIQKKKKTLAAIFRDGQYKRHKLYTIYNGIDSNYTAIAVPIWFDLH